MLLTVGRLLLSSESWRKGEFRLDWLATTLETIECFNTVHTLKLGLLTFTKPDGSLIDSKKDIPINTHCNLIMVFPGF